MSHFQTITVIVEGAPDPRPQYRGYPHRRGPATCKSCGQRIWWCLTYPNLRPIAFEHNPVAIEVDGDLATIESKGVHWEKCPNAEKYRKPAQRPLFS